MAHVLTAVTAVTVITRAEGLMESAQFGEVCITIDCAGTMEEEASMAEATTEADEECAQPGISMPVDLTS